MSTSDDIKEIFSKMPQAFVPENAAGLNAVIQMRLTGDGGGDWLLRITNGQLDVSQGKSPKPDLTLDMDAEDYVAISRGELDAKNLFMGGKIKLQGNMTLAFKFPELFSRDHAA